MAIVNTVNNRLTAPSIDSPTILNKFSTIALTLIQPATELTTAYDCVIVTSDSPRDLKVDPPENNLKTIVINSGVSAFTLSLGSDVNDTVLVEPGAWWVVIKDLNGNYHARLS